MIETLDDIIELLADRLGIYGSHAEDDPEEGCKCRVCWTAGFRERILRAVEVDRKLSA